jgi:hypothetical protein
MAVEMRRIFLVLILLLSGCDLFGGEETVPVILEDSGTPDTKIGELPTGADGAATPSDSTGGEDSVKPDTTRPPLCISYTDCDDGVSCTVDSCDPDVGCTNAPNNESCSDGVNCTVDICDPTLGCTNTPNGELCDDGLSCTINSCTPGAGGCINTPDHVFCDDLNPCTDDSCTLDEGCRSIANNIPCNDGNPCTKNDVCTSGVCKGESEEWTPSCAYGQSPNVAACQAGTTAEGSKTAALDEVNFIRGLSGLPPVVYSSGEDNKVQQASLMMVANDDLMHEPPAWWHCWTQAGFDGASTSNLYIMWGWDSEPVIPWDAITGFLIDTGVESLGHRRWVLDPFLSQISYGAVHGKPKTQSEYPFAAAAALHVIGGPDGDISDLDLDFVAYPVGPYPADYFDTSWYLSFSALVNKNSPWSNQDVSYQYANIQVTTGGSQKTVHSIKHSNQAYGLPNHIQWKVNGLLAGKTYTVIINDVKYDGDFLDYQYTFSLE